MVKVNCKLLQSRVRFKLGIFRMGIGYKTKPQPQNDPPDQNFPGQHDFRENRPTESNSTGLQYLNPYCTTIIRKFGK